MRDMYGEFTRQWNLLERTLTNLYGNLDRVSKLRRYGQEAPHLLEEIDERLIRDLLAQHCVYDEETRTVKSYVRESYVFLRKCLGLQPDLCTSCPTDVTCDRSFNSHGFHTFTGALLLISYQVRCNQAHLGKLEETERNAMLLQFATEVFEIANKASGSCIQGDL